jgi:hypothetical protein
MQCSLLWQITRTIARLGSQKLYKNLCNNATEARIARDAISAEPDSCLAVRTEFSAKQFVGDHLPASNELLCRASETDHEAASLLSVHPKNADGAILLVHLRG